MMKQLQRLQQLAQQSFVLIPFSLQKRLLEKALADLFAEAIDDGDLDFLEGRQLAVKIDDAPLHWLISFDGQAFVINQPTTEAEACISGRLGEFILLASRKEDPDTLFFQRRLAIQGDTELSLAVKNLLDTLDLSQMPAPIRFALDKAGNLQQQMQEANA